MEQNVIQKNMWNTAGKAGLALGMVSTAYLYITQWIGMSGVSAVVSTMANMLLWAVKFGGCIWLMMYFMKRFAAENPQTDNSGTFRMGIAAAFLSALVYSAFSFAHAAIFYPDLYAEQIDLVTQQMAPMLDSNMTAELEKTVQNLPQMIFFSNLIYCSIFGTILSFALSRSIPSSDPFADYKPEDQ